MLGGDKGTRTPDPLLAKQMLSQLSYAPTRNVRLYREREAIPSLRMGLLDPVPGVVEIENRPANQRDTVQR